MIKCEVLPRGLLPTRAEGDAGFDLYMPDGECIKAGKTKTVPLAIKLELPPGHFGLIKARSSIFEKGVNICGVIDEIFRGEISVMIQVLPKQGKDKFFCWADGDRLAQLLVIPYYQGGITDHTDLSFTKRGSDGFGSTGR